MKDALEASSSAPSTEEEYSNLSSPEPSTSSVVVFPSKGAIVVTTSSDSAVCTVVSTEAAVDSVIGTSEVSAPVPTSVGEDEVLVALSPMSINVGAGDSIPAVAVGAGVALSFPSVALDEVATVKEGPGDPITPSVAPLSVVREGAGVVVIPSVAPVPAATVKEGAELPSTLATDGAAVSTKTLGGAEEGGKVVNKSIPKLPLEDP
jgi:hypothetical protein